MNLTNSSKQLLSDLVQIERSIPGKQMLLRAWTMGRRIIAEEQGSGRSLNTMDLKNLVIELAKRELTILPSRLKKFRAFFLAFPDWKEVYLELSWTHYTQLLRLSEDSARRYYLQQAADNHWSTRELQRQIRSRSFERMGAGRAGEPSIAQMIRDNYVLEFIRLPEKEQLLERDLEQALLDQLQYFLLELGDGFAFVGRQKRIATETGKQFFIDLVFYHVLRKCYVLLDLKIGPLTHRDIG